jgi:DNA-directed RNA polymerase specialized sigma24 family protein
LPEKNRARFSTSQFENREWTRVLATLLDGIVPSTASPRRKETTMGSDTARSQHQAIDGAATPAPDVGDEPSLLRAALDRDDRAWREIVRSFESPMRDIVHETTAALCPLTEAEIDDLLADFWVRLVADDMRWLRAFDPSRGATLRTWLTFQVTHVAQEHIRKLRRDRKRFIPLDEAALELERHATEAFMCPVEGVSLSPDEKRHLARILGRALATAALAELGIGAP